MSTRGWSIAILVALLIIFIAYVVLLFELYKNQTFIFTPYKQAEPPANTFRPLGTVTPLTQEEINQRNAIIKASTGTAS